MNIAENIPFFNNLPPEIQSLILNVLLLVFALAVIWLLRNLVTRIVMTPVREMAARTRKPLDDHAIQTIERPIRLLVVGLGIAIVTALFDFNPALDRFADTLARALVLAAIALFIYNLLDMISFTTQTLRTLIGVEIEERLLPFLRVVVKVFIIVMGALIVIQEFGYDVTGLVASFGVIGLAFSLAAQDTASNVFGFTAIVGDNPFEVGDYIMSGDIAGVVEQVGVRSTRIRKLDQSLVVMPNNKLSSNPITNWTRLQKRRLDFTIGVTYRTSSDQMRVLLEQLRILLKSRHDIDPESVIVHFINFGESSLQIRIIAYIMLSDWAKYTAEVEQINLAIMEIVDEMGVEIAYAGRPVSPEPASKAEPVNQPKANATDARKYKTQNHPAVETGKAQEMYQDNPTGSSTGNEVKP
jgi:MscS family membrane protein